MHWFLTCLPALGLAVGLSGCSDDGVPADTDSNGSAASGAPTTSDADTNATSGPAGSTDGDGATNGESDPSGTATANGSTGAGVDTDGDTDTDTDAGTGSSGSSGGSTGGSGSTSTGGDGLAVGEDCTDDTDCASGVCWDFSDYDKTCGGAVCSVTCKTTGDCVEAFEAAGADSPKNATCGDDQRCDPVGTGFGAFQCASGG